MEKIIGQSNLQSGLNITIGVLAMAMVIYHLIAVFFSPLYPVLHANTHLTFVFLMIFLPALLKALEKGKRLASIGLSILVLLSLIGVGYVYIFAERLEMIPGRLSTIDLAVGVLLVALVIEACRRETGMALPGFAIAFIAYAFLGHYLPEPFGHPPISFIRIMSWFGMDMSSGIYGSLIYISANIIFLFILYGVILELTRAREFFTMLGLLVGRKIRGGAAQTSVVASGLVGMISGSPAANIVITGTVTIPLMKRTGFRPTVAAAVEATASTGGIFLPPVMGVVAFMMMSLTGLSYWEICIAAFIPAILYYLGVAAAVHLEAGKDHIPPVTEDVDLRVMLRRAPLFIVPFGLIVTLLALRYPPMYAAGWAMLVGAFLGFIRKETRPSWNDVIKGITRGAQTGAAIGAMITLSDLAFVSVMSLTAVAPKIAGAMHDWGGGYLPAILVITAFISLLIGTVNPIAGSYLLVALVVTPVLLTMKLSLIQAHFFALYYGILGMLTPPVAPSVIIASGIAKTRFMGSVLPALKMAGPAYLLPFMFCYDPALLAQFDRGLWLGLLSILVAVLAIITLIIVFFSYYLTKLSWPERGLAVVSWLGFLTYFFTRGNMLTVSVGAAFFILLTLGQLRKRAVLSRQSPISLSP